MGKEVLIVEDDPVFSLIVAAFLKKEGCVVRVAANGLDGLKALRQGIPDLLLSDLSMPVMTGLEFVEEVSLEYPMLPVIVISGTGGMSDVAQALRFGVKDFLIKPIEDILFVKSSILSVLAEADGGVSCDADFSQQWFKVSQNADQPFTEELKWHLDDLLDNPGSSRDLLMGLMPEPASQQGQWRLSYHSLQSADSSPIVLDYTWMMDGKMAFYMVDSASAGKNGTATTLMIRAFFNEYLRSQNADERGLIHLVHQIEHAIKKSTYASPIRAMFGMLDVVNNQLDLLSAGLNAIIDNAGNAIIVKNDHLIGLDAVNTRFQSIDMSLGRVRVSLSEVGLTSFSLDIQRLI